MTHLTPSEFLEALALLGLSVFQARRFRGTLSHPEQQLAAFFTHLGLRPLPAHDILMAGAEGAGVGSSGGAGAAARGGGGFGGGLLRREGAGAGGERERDPYAEWWGMRFEGVAGAGAAAGGSYRSSAFYNLVLLQVGRDLGAVMCGLWESVVRPSVVLGVAGTLLFETACAVLRWISM